MADPRNIIDFEGIGGVYATYLIDDSTITYSATATGGSAGVNLAVTLSTHKTVALAADGEAVIGKLVKVESDNKATVQVGGYTTLPGGASATLTVGTVAVGALGAASAKGYIRSAASATAAELIRTGPAIHDSGTTTAVMVKF